MTKLSLSEDVHDDGARLLSLGTPAHPLITEPMAASQDIMDVKALTLESITGMKIVKPMRIHRYRRG